MMMLQSLLRFKKAVLKESRELLAGHHFDAGGVFTFRSRFHELALAAVPGLPEPAPLEERCTPFLYSDFQRCQRLSQFTLEPESNSVLGSCRLLDGTSPRRVLDLLSPRMIGGQHLLGGLDVAGLRANVADRLDELLRRRRPRGWRLGLDLGACLCGKFFQLARAVECLKTIEERLCGGEASRRDPLDSASVRRFCPQNPALGKAGLCDGLNPSLALPPRFEVAGLPRRGCSDRRSQPLRGGRGA